MVKGYLIFDSAMGIVIKYGDEVLLEKVYAPTKSNIGKLCADIKSAGEDAVWYCACSTGIIGDKGVPALQVGEVVTGIAQADFDVIQYILKECGVYGQTKFVNMLTLYAEELENAACLYSVGGSIFGAVVNDGEVVAVDSIPYSNYNLYLSKLAQVCEFEQVVNMDNYVAAKYGDEDEACGHLLTYVEMIERHCLEQEEGAKVPEEEVEDGDLLAYVDDDDDDFTTEEVEEEKPKRPTRGKEGRPSRLKREEARSKREEACPKREEARPKREEARPKREEAEESDEFEELPARPTRGKAGRPSRPTRVERPTREEGRPSKKERKVLKKSSNGFLVLMLTLCMMVGALDGCNRFIMNVYTEKTTETQARLTAAIESTNEEIAQNEEMTVLLSSYDTVGERIS